MNLIKIRSSIIIIGNWYLKRQWKAINNHTATTLVLICLTWSREKVIVATLTGRNSTPSSPDRIGVWSSSAVVLFTKFQQKSNTVSETVEKILSTLVKMLPLLSSFAVEGKKTEGNVNGREGSSALCKHERRAPIKENPSPSEWWSLNIRVQAAWLVGDLIRWISHKGWLCGSCCIPISEM